MGLYKLYWTFKGKEHERLIRGSDIEDWIEWAKNNTDSYRYEELIKPFK